MLKKISCTFFALVTLITVSFSQSKWEGDNDVSFVYKFTETESINKKSKFKETEVATQSISSGSGEKGFLPQPPSGFAKISLSSNTGAWFGYQGKDNNLRLKAIASSSKPTETALAAVSKFALYGMETSAITAFFFTLDISAFAKDGMIVIPFGNSPTDAADNSNVFNNGTQASIWWDQPDLFGAIKLDLYDGPSLAYSYRKPRTGKADKQAPQFVELKSPSPFVKGKLHQIEIYCNNSTTKHAYLRDGESYTVEAQTYDLWVNGRRIQLREGSYSFPSSNETQVGKAVNSISINTSGNTKPSPNTLEIDISDISVHYVKQ